MNVELKHSGTPEETKFRTERLMSFLIRLEKELTEKIQFVNDHKGCLEVAWKHHAIRVNEFEAIKKSWELEGEYDIIIHFSA